MATYPQPVHMTVEEYLELDRNSPDVRYEYIDGQVVMMAGGTLDHATIGANLVAIFRRHLRGTPCRAYNSDARVRIAERCYVYPDVTISCDEHDRGRTDIILSPRLVVEVLSPSTEALDRGKKAFNYRQCPTMQEYLLVSADSPIVEIFKRQRNGLWLLVTLQFNDIVQLTSLDVQFPVQEIYEDVVF